MRITVKDPVIACQPGKGSWHVPGIYSFSDKGNDSGGNRFSNSSGKSRSSGQSFSISGGRSTSGRDSGVSSSSGSGDRDRDDDPDRKIRSSTKTQCQVSGDDSYEHPEPFYVVPTTGQRDGEKKAAVAYSRVQCGGGCKLIKLWFCYDRLHELFTPTVLRALTSKGQQTMFEVTDIKRANVSDLLKVYKGLLDRELSAEDGDDTVEIPFSNLFKVEHLIDCGYRYCEDYPQPLNRISVCKQNRESARVALLILPSILSKAVAFLDFTQGVITGNSFVIHPDLSVSMLSPLNVVSYLNSLDDFMVVIPECIQLSLYNFIEDTSEDRSAFLRKRANALTDIISGEAMKFAGNEEFYKIAERPLSQFSQRRFKSGDTISVLRALPGQLGLLHSEHVSGELSREGRGGLTLVTVLAASLLLGKHRKNKTSGS